MTSPPAQFPLSSRLEPCLGAGYIGLYPAGNFYLAQGDAADVKSLRQAVFYFAQETIALPQEAMPIAGFSRGVSAREDVRRWALTHPFQAPVHYPPLIWISSPEVLRGARMVDQGRSIAVAPVTIRFDVVPRIALNRSYYDASSVAFFSQRSVSARGISADGSFTARTLWPEDFRLDTRARVEPIAASVEAVRSLVRAGTRGGATSPFSARLLWERTPGAARDWVDKPVLAVLLNGAQGDDDEAHGGHMALISGRVGAQGAMGDWLANNFYALDSFSEKGIIAAPVPLDAYLADLNSGQSWYRPSYLIAAVLRSARVAARIQSALCRVYNQFYRHQLLYRHATMNCAGISVDALRVLGWRVPARGAANAALAFTAFPLVTARKRSFAQAIQAADYLSADQTRLFPAAAFEEIAADMLQLATGCLPRRATEIEAAFGTDVEALIFLRIPQLPSSRAYGDFPVVTTGEYDARLPADPADVRIVPVPPRPFPVSLRDPDLRSPPVRPGQWIAAGWAILAAIGLTWLIRKPRRSSADN